MTNNNLIYTLCQKIRQSLCNDVLMNIIGTPLFAHEETENQYSLDISFDNLLQLYTFLQLKYR